VPLPGTCQDTAVARIYEQLGSDITLITAPPGQSWALREAQQPPPPRETWALTHQLNLAEGNVAVALGKASGGLAALLASDRKALADFIAANPALAGLLPVEHPAGSVVFIRVIGPMPASRTLGGFTWLADEASLTVLTRLPRRWDAFAGSTSPRASAPVRLDTLDWRPLGEFGLGLVYDALRLTHGSVFSNPVAGRRRLNSGFWLDYLPHALPLRFHVHRNEFQELDAAGRTWADRPRLVVMSRIDAAIRELIAQGGGSYQHTATELRNLVASLQRRLVCDVPEGREFFRSCVAACVVRRECCDVTMAEIRNAIAALHLAQGRPMPSVAMAGRWISKDMAELFNAPKHRNLIRAAGWQRGFHGVALCSPVQNRAD